MAVLPADVSFCIVEALERVLAPFFTVLAAVDRAIED